MTTTVSAEHSGGALFVADFYPQLGEYLAARHATGYDAGAARARFLAWLTGHAVDDPPDSEPVRDYLAQIAMAPRLTAGQEAELDVRIGAGHRPSGGWPPPVLRCPVLSGRTWNGWPRTAGRPGISCWTATCAWSCRWPSGTPAGACPFLDSSRRATWA